MKTLLLALRYLFRRKPKPTKMQFTIALWYAIGQIKRAGKHDI